MSCLASLLTLFQSPEANIHRRLLKGNVLVGRLTTVLFVHRGRNARFLEN
jgi:hypothetical protein